MLGLGVCQSQTCQMMVTGSQAFPALGKIVTQVPSLLGSPHGSCTGNIIQILFRLRKLARTGCAGPLHTQRGHDEANDQRKKK